MVVANINAWHIKVILGSNVTARWYIFIIKLSTHIAKRKDGLVYWSVYPVTNLSALLVEIENVSFM